MTKAQLPHRQQNISPKRLFGVLIALVVFFILLTSVINLCEKYFALKRHRRELYEQQGALAEKKAILQKTNEYLQTDEGKEQALREKYNVVKPGEGMVIITEPPKQKVLPPPRSRVGRWCDIIVGGLGFRKE